ncbi:MAG: 30S ribosomal protein S5 [bacterium]
MDTNPTQSNTPVEAKPAPKAGTAPTQQIAQAEGKNPQPVRSGFGGFSRGGARGGASAGGDRPRRGPAREPRAKPEFDQKIISIRRVTRVAAGGRRFTFSVAIAAGNRKGWVGVGTGKAGDTAIAIDKAMRSAKKHMIKLSLTKDMSVPYDVDAKYCSARVSIRPNRAKGLVAGSSVRNVLELAGVKNVTAKLFSGTKDHLNNARAAIKALSVFDPKNVQHRLVRPARAAHTAGTVKA